METKRVLATLSVTFAVVVCLPEVSGAAPLGTAFTYQGRLIDANEPADGVYEFEFKLYDSPTDGNQLDGTVAFRGVDVIDGYFTVELDFGDDAFAGDARWLEIGVRPSGTADPFATLGPRQEVTPTPYALYAKSAGGDNDWMVSGNDMYAIPSGNVGIGTAPTDAGKLQVSTSSGTSVYGEVTGGLGSGVSGIASNTGNYITYGGYFKSEGAQGRGVVAAASGSSGRGVYAAATNTGDVTNYGGYFYSSGASGRGVYGEAARTGSFTNYGGYFVAKGDEGRGVYGKSTATGFFFNYGGYFESAGTKGGGVRGEATGSMGSGVMGYASGYNGVGVVGRSFHEGDGLQYGGYFEAEGSNGVGVYGSGDGYAGYFAGNVHVVGTLSATSKPFI